MVRYSKYSYENEVSIYFESYHGHLYDEKLSKKNFILSFCSGFKHTVLLIT